MVDKERIIKIIVCSLQNYIISKQNMIISFYLKYIVLLKLFTQNECRNKLYISKHLIDLLLKYTENQTVCFLP